MQQINQKICKKNVHTAKSNNHVGLNVCGVCTNFQCKCDLSALTISPSVSLHLLPYFPPIHTLIQVQTKVIYVRFCTVFVLFLCLMVKVIYRLTGHAGHQLEWAKHPECPGRGKKGENNALAAGE